jgi:peptide deformylase
MENNQFEEYKRSRGPQPPYRQEVFYNANGEPIKTVTKPMGEKTDPVVVTETVNTEGDAFCVTHVLATAPPVEIASTPKENQPVYASGVEDTAKVTSEAEAIIDRVAVLYSNVVNDMVLRSRSAAIMPRLTSKDAEGRTVFASLFHAQEVALKLCEVAKATGGFSVSAPQIGETVRVVLLNNTAMMTEGKRGYTIMINPNVTLGDGIRKSIEGCLSLPGKFYEVQRSASVRATWLDIDGSPMSGSFSGLEAIVLQHEVDHLNGVMIDTVGKEYVPSPKEGGEAPKVKVPRLVKPRNRLT